MKQLAWLVFATVFVACQNLVGFDEVVDDSVESIQLEESTVNGTSVSMAEVEKIASSFYGGEVKTRVSDRSVETISVINDDSGNPAIYVVNYADDKGFVLISATKNFIPVLAYSDKGHFSVGKSYVDGLDDWMENMEAIIGTVSAYPVDSAYAYKGIWNKYLQTTDTETFGSVNTRSSVYDMEVYAHSCMNQWASEGYSVCRLSEFSSSHPLYERFCSVAQGMTYIDYDYLQHSIVRSKRHDSSSSKDNFVSTAWGQELGFSSQLPTINGQYPKAGCVTIAMAQVMKYHEYPTTFDWDAMPDWSATLQTAKLIRELGDAIHAEYGLDGTPASLENVRNALVSKYGYASTARLISHSSDAVVEELKANRPVIMSGFPETGAGHAWIASGYKHTNYYEDFELMVMPEEYYPGSTFGYITGDSGKDILDTKYFYMNWGWYGADNAFYYDANLYIDRTNGRLCFNKDRRDLIGIQPN